MLKLMFITNSIDVAKIAQGSGVDRIFIDLEYIGKSERQSGLDTVKSTHTIQDIARIRPYLKQSELLVRCNPIHNQTEFYSSSEDEINTIIKNGADIIMLPYFKSREEVEKFLKYVNGRVKTILLFETKESVDILDSILSLPGIDEVFIGLNDLSLSYQKKFMFELLSDGTVDKIVKVFKQHNIPFGFGGIASLGKGLLPSEYIIKEHYRLGSSIVILSRSFCNVSNNIVDINHLFNSEIKKIRDFENTCLHLDNYEFYQNKIEIKNKINDILKGMNS